MSPKGLNVSGSDEIYLPQSVCCAGGLATLQGDASAIAPKAYDCKLNSSISL
jgi:hypothetical protein